MSVTGDFLTLLYEVLGPPLIGCLKKVFQKEKILIVGAGGVGKTTMGKLLAASMSLLELQPDYAESMDTEVYAMGGRRKARLHVVAGQEHRRDATWGEPLKMVRGGEITGLILVNAFGYHSIGPFGVRGQALYSDLKSAGKEGMFLEAHVEAMRKKEVEVLQYIAPAMKARTKGKLWMMSVVTKENLWFDDSDKVQQYYSEGEYNDLVDSIRASLGSNSFRHEYAPVSLVIQDFVTGRGEKLASRSHRYDQTVQVESASRFYQTLSSLC